MLSGLCAIKDSVYPVGLQAMFSNVFANVVKIVACYSPYSCRYSCRIAVYLIVIVATVGCVSPNPPSRVEYMPTELSRVSAVAVTAPGFQLERGKLLTWSGDLIWLQAVNASADDIPVTANVIQREIEEQFAELGFSFVTPSAPSELITRPPDYQLQSVAILSDSAEGLALENLIRLYPSLAHVPGTLERGTLLMVMSRPGSPVILWRAGVQAFVVEDLAPEMRNARLQTVVRSLLRTLPLADQSQ